MKTVLSPLQSMTKDDLENSHDPDTGDAWKESVDRCDILSDILKPGNLDLSSLIHVKTPNHDTIIP